MTDNLDKQKRTLEQSIDSLGRYMIFFTALVAIGLVIELYRPVVTLLHTFDIWTMVEIAGTSLVAGGVAGELLVEFRAHRKEKELREVNLRIEGIANANIANLNRLTEQERCKRTEMELEVEQLRQENHQVALFLKDRSIMSAGDFVVSMTAFAGTVAEIGVIRGDSPETINLWNSLKDLLRAANWQISEAVNGLGPNEAVAILLTKADWSTDSPARRAAIALGNALNDNNVVPVMFDQEFMLIYDDPRSPKGLRPGTVIVNVGNKLRTPGHAKLLQDHWKRSVQQAAEPMVPKDVNDQGSNS